MTNPTPARPGAAQIERICAEWAEAAWLFALRRGMTDPVIELLALDPSSPGRVHIVAVERTKLALVLRQHCPGAATMLVPPTDRSLTIVIMTPEGIDIDHRSAPE